MSKISVIVPVHNVEKYVELCLRSILDQTFQNFEILVVDDGSSDGSGDICDRLAKEDSRIRVIHQESRGVSAARNAALRAASGDYIAPVDSDDILESVYLEELYRACEENDAQVSVCDYRRIPDIEENRNGCSEEKREHSEKSGDVQKGEHKACLFTSAECLRNMYHPISSGMGFMVWGKLYRRSLFAEHGIECPEGKIHEDQAVTYRLIAYADRIAYVGRELYLYRARKGSIMQRPFGRDRLDLMDATKGQCDFFLDRGEQEIAGLAVNNHLRTEFSLLCCVRDRKKIVQAGAGSGAEPEEGSQDAELKQLNEAEKKVIMAIRRDTPYYLSRVSLRPVRRAAFRLAARVPVDLFASKLRMF